MKAVAEMIEVQIKRTFPATVAFLEMKGSFSQVPEAFGKLYAWIETQGYTAAGMPIGLYLSDPADTPAEELMWELWSPIDEFAEPRNPHADGLGVKRIEPMSVASTMHRGPYESIAPIYAELAQWVAENGHEIVGPPMEVYYSDLAEVPPEEYLTEIQMPIAG